MEHTPNSSASSSIPVGDSAPSSVSSNRWQQQLYRSFKPRWMANFEEAVQYGYHIGPTIGFYDGMDIPGWIELADENQVSRFHFDGLYGINPLIMGFSQGSVDGSPPGLRSRELIDGERRIGPFRYALVKCEE